MDWISHKNDYGPFETVTLRKVTFYIFHLVFLFHLILIILLLKVKKLLLKGKKKPAFGGIFFTLAFFKRQSASRLIGISKKKKKLKN